MDYFRGIFSMLDASPDASGCFVLNKDANMHVAICEVYCIRFSAAHLSNVDD